MLLVSIAEVVSIGTLLPFLGALTAPDKIFNHELARPYIALARLEQPRDLLFPLTCTFMLAAILAGAMRVALLWFQTTVSMAIGVDFSVKVYENALNKPYSFHVSSNSSEIVATTEKAAALVLFVIQPTLLIIGSVLILTSVLSLLLIIEPLLSLVTFLGFLLMYFVFVAGIRGTISRNGSIISEHQGKVYKAIYEGLGGIRDVILDGAQSIYVDVYRRALTPMHMAKASIQTVGSIPRYGVEAVGIVFIAHLAYQLTEGSRLAEVVSEFAVSTANRATITPILYIGAIAMGAQRLLPLLQQIYTAYVTMKGAAASIEDAINFLDEPHATLRSESKSVAMSFNKHIVIEDLGFQYASEGPWILRNVNLRIPKGSRVGFLGTTGSGKSTLVDLIMGLLSPTTGSIYIDEILITKENSRAWQANLSHVPQTIFLSDTTITENIAFGVPIEQINRAKVKEAANLAQLADTISELADGYDTLVGERGIRLSGGQRQRIGIARALYRNADVIVLDEATSSLDKKTEAYVMSAILGLASKPTILIIAHSQTALMYCDYIYKVNKGEIQIITQAEFLGKR